jgi:hypothetical protein
MGCATVIVRMLERFDRLMDATSLSRLLGRPRSTIQAHCEPLACDVASRRLLYGARHSSSQLSDVPTRNRKGKIAA